MVGEGRFQAFALLGSLDLGEKARVAMILPGPLRQAQAVGGGGDGRYRCPHDRDSRNG